MFKKALSLFLLFASFSGFSQDLTATVNTANNVIPGQDLIVELTVNKPASSGFMKYFQELPSGYSASSIESKGGDFKFADNGAKIVWVSPPMDNQYTISYKITTPANASGTILIGGKFSYIVNNERKEFNVVPKNVSLKQTMDETPPKELIKEPIKEKLPEKEIPKEKVPEPKKENAPVIITTPAKAPTTASTIISGKTYKVQIGAFTTKPKIEGVTEISTVVLDNGVTKYFCGNFKTYEEAAKKKKELIEKGFQGAFVVSFENGKIVK